MIPMLAPLPFCGSTERLELALDVALRRLRDYADRWDWIPFGNNTTEAKQINGAWNNISQKYDDDFLIVEDIQRIINSLEDIEGPRVTVMTRTEWLERKLRGKGLELSQSTEYGTKVSAAFRDGLCVAVGRHPKSESEAQKQLCEQLGVVW